MSVGSFTVRVRCDDCTDVGEYGCNGGEPWRLGPFETRAEAERAGDAEVADCGPWHYEIEEASP